MTELYYWDTQHTIACVKANRAYPITNKIAKTIVDLLQKSKRTDNFAKDIHNILKDATIMNDNRAFLPMVTESYKTWFMKIDIPVTKTFLAWLVHDYTTFVSTMSDDMKNKYHINNALNSWNMTWFAKRHSWEHDFFLYREEFIFSGNDTAYIAKMKKDKNVPKEYKEFLAKCQIVYDAALFSLMSMWLTMNYLRTFDTKKKWEYSEIPLQTSRSRLVFWDYQKVSPEWNLNCDAHIDSSMINSVLYQSKPGLEVSGYGTDNYIPIHIWWSEMVVFGGRDAREKTWFLLPSPHKVTSNARRRVSMWFDLNPKDEYEQFVTNLASKVYKEF